MKNLIFTFECFFRLTNKRHKRRFLIFHSTHFYFVCKRKLLSFQKWRLKVLQQSQVFFFQFAIQMKGE